MNLTLYSGFNLNYNDGGIDNVIDFAKRTGFSSLEPLSKSPEVLFGSDENVKIAAEKAAENGLTYANYSVYANVLEGFDFTLEFLKKNVDVAKTLGSPFMHHTIIPHLELTPDMPSFKEGLDLALKLILPLADYAESKGIKLLYEPQGMYFNGVKGFGELFYELKKHTDNVGVCGDVGNVMFVDEMPYEFFNEYAKYMDQVHLKNYIKSDVIGKVNSDIYHSRGGEALVDCYMTEGIIDYTPCFKALKAVNYNGGFAFECNINDETVVGNDIKFIVNKYEGA